MPRLMVIFLLFAIGVATWFRPDPLALIAHVAQILSRASPLGMAAQIFAIVSLTLVSRSIVLGARRGTAVPFISIATYFVVYLALSLLHPFPISFPGYGAAPVLGFYLFVAFFRIGQREK